MECDHAIAMSAEVDQDRVTPAEIGRAAYERWVERNQPRMRTRQTDDGCVDIIQEIDVEVKKRAPDLATLHPDDKKKLVRRARLHFRRLLARYESEISP